MLSSRGGRPALIVLGGFAGIGKTTLSRRLSVKAMLDNGTQMKAKTMREFLRDLGIDQVFSRPHTPEDNAYIEAWFATAKCEGIYREEYGDPLEAHDGIAERALE